MGFREDEYKMNIFLKLRAQDYIRNPGDETMANVNAIEKVYQVILKLFTTFTTELVYHP